MSKDMPPAIKILADWGRKACAELDKAKEENTEWQEQIADHCIEIAELRSQLATANKENERLRRLLQEASRIVEKYKDACFEWAKESHRKGNRQDKEFWERRTKSMAALVSDIHQFLKGQPPCPDPESRKKT